MLRLTMIVLTAAATAVIAPAAASAQDSRFAVGVGVGTTGFEGQIGVGLSDRFSIRGAGNFLEFDIDREFDDIEFAAVYEGSTLAGLFDVRPFANAFTLTGGAYFGSREAAITATPTQDVEIGDQTYTPAEVGSLVGTLELGDTAPYLGFGFDNTFTGEGRLGFRLGLGVSFGEEPVVNLASVGGTLSSDPSFQAELQQEEDNISEDADLLRYYPVISTGFFIKF